ncbi:glycosyltransferase [Mesorhizobium sp.]|uniref:glycosyltransferase family 2 protein n=1 Tax=Mesorhizobium sp. TaxID=1871066 RepID=UPI000FEA1A01|nr:glycosyltransferase [Mesorhizobium sp.]RWD31997.1 MAG: glycosyltransferase [Mesorhizobium sp.]
MAERPELAVVVIGLRAPAELVAAVRSALDQNAPFEVVVVNSGGGDVQALLGRAGLDVRVIEVGQRLFAGAARNIGLRRHKLRSSPSLPRIASPARAGQRSDDGGLWMADLSAVARA